MVFNISVTNKVARLVNENVYGVCGNSDYIIQFTFDEEWAELEAKTLQVNYAGQYVRVVFTGTTCNLPVIPSSGCIEIGVFAGDLHTTTPAVIPFIDCITSKTGVPVAPTPDVYAQIIQMLSDAVTTADEARSDIENMTVDAVSLPEGSAATAEKTGGDGTPYNIRFGIPRGQRGETGPQGEQGIGIGDVAEADFLPSEGTGTVVITNIAHNAHFVDIYGTLRQTMDDDSVIDTPAKITLPLSVHNGFSLSVFNDNEHHRSFLQLGPTTNPQSAFVPLSYGGDEPDGQNVVYGGSAGGEWLTDTRPIPIDLTKRGLFMSAVMSDEDYYDNYGSSEGCYANALLGKFNETTLYNTENFASGGHNIIKAYAQDTGTIGYRNEVYANQAFTSGYKNKNYANESALVGNQNIIYGTITHYPQISRDNGASSDSKYDAVFGFKNILQHGAESDLVSGDQNTLDIYAKWDFVTGSHHQLGKHNVCVAALDYGNITGDYVEDSTMIGYYNHIYGGSAGSVVYAVNMLGNNNDNRDRNNEAKSEVTFVGSGLRAGGKNQTLIGRYNKYTDLWDTSEGVLIGAGTDDSNRKTVARFHSNDVQILEDLWLMNGATLKIGNTVLTEAQLQQLLALL